MAWSFINASAAVETVTTTLTLTEPASAASGDLLVAFISARQTDLNSITLPTGWRRCGEEKNNSSSATSAAQTCGMMAYIVRGGSAPSFAFTWPAAPNIAIGTVQCFRDVNTTKAIDAKTSVTTATAITSISVSGLTTTSNGSLVVVGIAGGQESVYSSVQSANGGAFTQHSAAQTTTGADTGLYVGSQIMTTAGAIGNVTATASISSGHSVIQAAFRISSEAVPPTVFGTMNGAFRNNAASILASNVLAGDADIEVGDIIVAVIAEQNANTAASASDNLGNSYTAQNAGNLSSVGCRAFYSIATVAGILTSITINSTGSSNNYAAIGAAWTGKNATLDKSPSNLTDATTPFDCPSSTTLSQADELVVGWIGTNSGSAIAATSPSTLVGPGEISSTVAQAALSSRVVAATTAVAPQFTGTSANSVVGTLTFAKGSTNPTGTLAVTEATDTAAFTGSATSGSLAVTEATDTAAFTGSATSGSLAVTETADTAAFAGSPVINAQLAVTEGADTVAFTDAPVGTLAVTENTDTAAFTGSATSGPLAVTEATDTLVFAVDVIISAQLAVTEITDTTAFDGTVDTGGGGPFKPIPRQLSMTGVG